jgi:hypothetical protein
MFEAVDMTQPYTIVRVSHPTKIPFLRRPLAPGTYYFQGDLRTKIRKTDDRERCSLGLYTMEFVGQPEIVRANKIHEPQIPAQVMTAMPVGVPTPEVTEIASVAGETNMVA